MSKRSSKRIVQSSDSEEEDHIPTTSSRPTKRPRTAEDYIDVVREAKDDHPAPTRKGTKRPLLQSKNKRGARRVVDSEEHSDGDDDVGGPAYDPNTDLGTDNDNEFVPTPLQKKVAPRAGGPGKGKGPMLGKSREAEIKRSRSSEGDVVAPSSPLTPDPEVKPPPTKKIRLPPIKKNKLVPTAAVSSTSGSAGLSTPASAKPGAFSVPSGKGTPSSVPRKPAATVGNADFDLRNANVYKDLFKTVGSRAPAGVNRADKDEKRKELDRMRDAARAERLAAPCFDLQAACDKVTDFEDRMKARNSHACYANILAGAFKVTR